MLFTGRKKPHVMFTQHSGEVGLDELHMLLEQHIKPPQTTESCFIGSPAVSTENGVRVREQPPSTPLWTQRESSQSFTRHARLRTQMTNPLELESPSKFIRNLITCSSTCACCTAWLGQSPHDSRYRTAPLSRVHAQVKGQQPNASLQGPVTPTPHSGLGITRTYHTTAFYLFLLSGASRKWCFQ